jgi:hypothetical protein
LLSEYFTHRRSAGTHVYHFGGRPSGGFFLSLAWLKIKKFTLQQLFTKLASIITVRFEELIVARLVKNFSAY